MSETVNFFLGLVVAGSAALATGCFGVFVLRKNRHVSQLPDEDFPEGTEQPDFDAVDMAVCVTQAGKKTHYRKLGTSNRVKGKPTLCGVKVHHDLKDQNVDASCQTCNNALVKFGYPLI